MIHRHCIQQTFHIPLIQLNMPPKIIHTDAGFTSGCRWSAQEGPYLPSINSSQHLLLPPCKCAGGTFESEPPSAQHSDLAHAARWWPNESIGQACGGAIGKPGKYEEGSASNNLWGPLTEWCLLQDKLGTSSVLWLVRRRLDCGTVVPLLEAASCCHLCRTPPGLNSSGSRAETLTFLYVPPQLCVILFCFSFNLVNFILDEYGFVENGF